MEFGDRLKSMRIEKKITQQKFADEVGVSVVTVRNWEYNSKKPTMDAILSIAKVLQVSIDALLGFSLGHTDELALSSDERRLLLDFRMLDGHGQKTVRTICSLEKDRVVELAAKATSNIVKLQSTTQKRRKPLRKSDRFIPRYTTPAAAGYSVPLDGADFEMLLVDDSVPPQADYAVDIQGDSMYPYIKDGDMVYVQKDCQISVGDIGIFCVDGAMYCKQYYIDDDRNLLLVSANPELKESNVFVSAESGSVVTFCGKVLLGCRTELPDYLFEE